MMNQEDVITDISEAREKFFGCSGKMLLPGRATVEAFVKKIPERKVVTMDVLQRTLAEQFNVQATCPVAARKALQAIAKDALGDVPFWRVVKKNGELMAIFPGGVAGHRRLLATEGVAIDSGGRASKIANLKETTTSFSSL